MSIKIKRGTTQDWSYGPELVHFENNDIKDKDSVYYANGTDLWIYVYTTSENEWYIANPSGGDEAKTDGKIPGLPFALPEEIFNSQKTYKLKIDYSGPEDCQLEIVGWVGVLVRPDHYPYEDNSYESSSPPRFFIKWPKEKVGQPPELAKIRISFKEVNGYGELEEGQLGLEYTENGKIKLKAGAKDKTKWNELPYVAGDENSVLYTEQTLTPEQQEQARNNIGINNTGATVDSKLSFTSHAPLQNSIISAHLGNIKLKTNNLGNIQSKIEQTFDITYGTNLLDLTKVTIGWLTELDDVYLIRQGDDKPFYTSDFIPVKQGEVYSLQGNEDAQSSNRVIQPIYCYAWYAEDRETLIGDFGYHLNDGVTNVTAPNLAKYVRITYRSDTISPAFVQGEELLPYTEYQAPIYKVKEEVLPENIGNSNLLVVKYEGEKANYTSTQIVNHIKNNGQAIFILQKSINESIILQPIIILDDENDAIVLFGMSATGPDSSVHAILSVGMEGTIEILNYAESPLIPILDDDVTVNNRAIVNKDGEWVLSDEPILTQEDISSLSSRLTTLETTIGNIDAALDAILGIQDELINTALPHAEGVEF